jgi:hypothetical protein
MPLLPQECLNDNAEFAGLIGFRITPNLDSSASPVGGQDGYEADEIPTHWLAEVARD